MEILTHTHTESESEYLLSKYIDQEMRYSPQKTIEQIATSVKNVINTRMA